MSRPYAMKQDTNTISNKDAEKTSGMKAPKKSATADASPDRMARLKAIPRLKEEAYTIACMAKLYCKRFHFDAPKDENGLCPNCREFLEYAKKRLACCPYGAQKPVCAKCRIHCYKPAQKEKAKAIMRWAGPRLLFQHPILTVKHILYSHKEAPDKPRNRKQSKRIDAAQIASAKSVYENDKK